MRAKRYQTVSNGTERYVLDYFGVFLNIAMIQLLECCKPCCVRFQVCVFNAISNWRLLCYFMFACFMLFQVCVSYAYFKFTFSMYFSSLRFIYFFQVCVFLCIFKFAFIKLFQVCVF